MFKFLLLSLFFLSIFFNCSENGNSSKSKTLNLNYVGCGITKTAFMGEMAKAYEKETGIKVIVSGGGATKGIRSVSKNLVDIGGGCRHKMDIKEEEKAYPNHVAWDALVVIVNPSNSINNLSLEDLKKVLTGKVKTWKQFNGSTEKITVVARVGKDSGVGKMVRELIFNNSDQDFTSLAKSFPSTGPLEKAIEKNPTAIGITGVSSAKKRKVKVLTIDGIEPNIENITTGKYQLYRPLYLYSNGKPQGEVKKFIDFVKSPKGQDIIKKQGTITLKEGTPLKSLYKEKMEKMNMKSSLWQ